MATKDELEAETTELKAQLAELQAVAQPPAPEDPADEVDTSADPEEASSEDAPKDELHQLVDQVTGVLEDHPSVKPLLLVLGVFGIGYLLGRAR